MTWSLNRYPRWAQPRLAALLPRQLQLAGRFSLSLVGDLDAGGTKPYRARKGGPRVPFRQRVITQLVCATAGGDNNIRTVTCESPRAYEITIFVPLQRVQ